MYTPTQQRKQDERQTALLWLFIASRGQLQEFREFYKLHHSQTLAEIENELKKLTKLNNDGK